MSKLSDVWNLKVNKSNHPPPSKKYIKRNCNFDQVFINEEEDVPLEKRRYGLLNQSCIKFGGIAGRAPNLPLDSFIN